MPSYNCVELGVAVLRIFNPAVVKASCFQLLRTILVPLDRATPFFCLPF